LVADALNCGYFAFSAGGAMRKSQSATPVSGYSVAALCQRYHVGADKVRAWIRSGELIAVNVAADLGGKPQWRITPESVEVFERRRSSEPAPKLQRRRKRLPEVRDYYP
jgi:hypothetical protein